MTAFEKYFLENAFAKKSRIFNSLKEPFLNQENNSKPFKKHIFLRKQEQCSYDRLFFLFLNIHKLIIQRQFDAKQLAISNNSSISANASVYTELSLKQS